jgi:hypothetical protein
MQFARWVFRIAGILGLLVLVPEYFLEHQIGRDQPPPITHPEFFYGFVGVALAWQVAFLLISLDPPRYRLFMLPAMIEKFSFAAAMFVLFALGRVPALMLAAGVFDGTLGMLFGVAYFLCPGRSAVPGWQCSQRPHDDE